MTDPINPEMFLGFTPDTPDEECRRAFEAHYHRPPAHIFPAGACKLAGPIPDRPVTQEQPK